MRICNHAIRRYKQRIGKRTASRKRIVSAIRSEINSNVIRRYRIKKSNHIMIETPKFTAVCYKGTVLTILFPQDVWRQKRGDQQDVL